MPPPAASHRSKEIVVLDEEQRSPHADAGCGTSNGAVSTVALDLGRTGAHRAAMVTATERVRRLWSAGDEARIEAGYREGAEAFASRATLGPGVAVLDAACGSGNVAIAAARTGATVTAVDIVASSVEATAARAIREALTVSAQQADVERLPHADARFDVVLSLFGVMFAARPDRVLAELARVTRPGGIVRVGSWSLTGFMGDFYSMHDALVGSPLDAPDPLGWGDAATASEWFDETAWEVTAEERSISMRYPHTPAGTAELFRAAHGPTVHAFASLDVDDRAEFALQVLSHWRRSHRSTSRGTAVSAEYLEVVAVRR
jgi:SAM-dependent methyltransferase